MNTSERIKLATKPPRLRGGALVAVAVGGIGLLFTGAGFIQYLFYGVVTVIPDRAPADGSEAVEMLSHLALISGLFLISGVLLRYRARRISKKLRTHKDNETGAN